MAWIKLLSVSCADITFFLARFVDLGEEMTDIPGFKSLEGNGFYTNCFNLKLLYSLVTE
jgi:hypothetical protein